MSYRLFTARVNFIEQIVGFNTRALWETRRLGTGVPSQAQVGLLGVGHLFCCGTKILDKSKGRKGWLWLVVGRCNPSWRGSHWSMRLLIYSQEAEANASVLLAAFFLFYTALDRSPPQLTQSQASLRAKSGMCLLLCGYRTDLWGLSSH